MPETSLLLTYTHTHTHRTLSINTLIQKPDSSPGGSYSKTSKREREALGCVSRVVSRELCVAGHTGLPRRRRGVEGNGFGTEA